MSAPAGTNTLARVAVVDYGMGNLFSVARACETVGLAPLVTDDPAAVEAADGIVLPGVGAFGEAMTSLIRLGLASVLQRAVRAGRPLLGICLGMQLLAREGEEFGRYAGLGLVPGHVRKLAPRERVKLPHIGWTAIEPVLEGPGGTAWRGTLLEDVAPGAPMYFVHSFVFEPDSASVVRAVARYGDTPFCAALESGPVTGCQFHPERSGVTGLSVYRSFARRVDAARGVA